MITGLSSCQSIFFYPHAELYWTPALANIEFEEHSLPTDSRDFILVWKLIPKTLSTLNSSKGVVVFLHGNAENMSTHTQGMLWLIDAGYVVYAVDYRGFGGSGGSPSITNAKEDVLNFLNWVGKKETDQRLIVIGQSIGASLLLSAMRDWENRDRASHLILDSPFCRYRRIARESVRGALGGVLSYLASGLVSDCCPPEDGLGYIPKTTKVVFIHAEDDQLVGVEHSSEMYRSIREWHPDASFWKLQGGGHIALARDEDVQAKMLNILEKSPAAK